MAVCVKIKDMFEKGFCKKNFPFITMSSVLYAIKMLQQACKQTGIMAIWQKTLLQCLATKCAILVFINA